MIRILIFLALMAALIAALIVVTTPHRLLIAVILGIAALVVQFAWHCAGNLARGRPKPDTENAP